jgi:hypothetical protein
MWPFVGRNYSIILLLFYQLTPSATRDGFKQQFRTLPALCAKAGSSGGQPAMSATNLRQLFP